MREQREGADMVHTAERPAAANPRFFRDVLAHNPTGVALVTAMQPDGTPVGMIVGTFVSVSLDPPLVAFLPGKSSTSWPKIREAGSFAVNVLSSEQSGLCRSFSKASAQDKFAGIEWSRSERGNPILDGCVAWVDCTVTTTHEAGDHEIVVGLVHDLAIERPAAPLVFFRGGFGEYADVAAASATTVERKAG
ncbi:flavin reductase family protein [Agromyces humatus]|nr:flavin reductase family protein [Agromyces humatus]